ncbi:hypothetical protein BKA70DRAFT_1096086 [Coprinopsis sp. MPI-PUGE-AT-0042]|nr:hypothetical protein BKA70DRAFT_1096086 [Coprinopsis sp. MPI-PUGE-AT-0042]
MNHPSAQPGAPSPNTSQSKGKGKATVDPQEYQTYTQELEKMFGKQAGDMDVSVSRLRDPSDGTTRESFVIGRVKGTPPKAKPKVRTSANPPPFIVGKKIVQQPKGNVSRNVTHASSSRSKEGQPPKPRQDFEEISRRVIESTPDKTVTISTWREQVAQETTVEEEDGSLERISVYYVSGHAQPDAVANATAELDDLGARPPPPVSAPKEKPAPKEKEFQELPQLQHTMTSQPLAEIMALSPEAHLEDSRLLDEHVEQYMSPQSRATAAPSWIRPSQYLPSTVANAIREHQRPSSSQSSFDDDDDEDDESESRSPSQFPPTPPPKAAPTLPRLKTGSKLMQSTPVVSAFAMPSFHPTRDGSIISSINSGDHHDLPHPSNIIQSPDHLYPSPRPSMSPKGLRTQVLGSTNSLEGVLNSCRPSLRHLVPTLAHLGITTKDHLHALAELDPETRDRELKEEALRGGVTNMEWAMLMNRLKSL